MLIDIVLQWLSETYWWLPGGYIIPMLGAVTGFSYAMYRYVRSFKYLYHYYIETGEVLCWMDCDTHTEMVEMNKKHRLKLDDNFKNFGYIGGMAALIPFTVIGAIIGSVWPLAVAIGILTIPNFVLKRIAREKRSKAVFKQKLEAEGS